MYPDTCHLTYSTVKLVYYDTCLIRSTCLFCHCLFTPNEMKLIYYDHKKCEWFDVVFQGMVDFRVLQIHSTFRDKMEVIGVTFQPPDSRFYYQPPNTDKILLFPDKHTNVSSGIYLLSSFVSTNCDSTGIWNAVILMLN